MKDYKQVLQENCGATSVLIMVMMIILMVLGMAALTTSAASKKLANKNASWLSEYYALQGKAEMAYAELVDGLQLEEADSDLRKVEAELTSYSEKNADFHFHKTDKPEQPFELELTVNEDDKEDGNRINMTFFIRKSGQGYALHTEKWMLMPAEIFSSEDELHFSDINPE